MSFRRQGHFNIILGGLAEAMACSTANYLFVYQHYGRSAMAVKTISC